MDGIGPVWPDGTREREQAEMMGVEREWSLSAVQVGAVVALIVLGSWLLAGLG